MAEDEVARELKNIHSTMTEIQSDIRDIKAGLADMKSDIGGQDTVTTELREQTGLLKSVLVQVRRRVENVDVRKQRW